MTDVALTPRVLVVEGNPGVRAFLSEALRFLKETLPVELCEDASKVHGIRPSGGFSLIILDSVMPRRPAVALLKNNREGKHPAPVLFMTRKRSIPIGVSKLGNIHLLQKPFGLRDLRSILETVLPSLSKAGPSCSPLLEGPSPRIEPPTAPPLAILPSAPEVSSVPIPSGCNGLEAVNVVPSIRRPSPAEDSKREEHRQWLKTYFIGEHPRIDEARKAILAFAPGKLPISILGGAGTGKELVAQAIHRCSPRRHGRFQIAHCASLAETLLESELFGHVKGAFTGAVARRAGRFAQADGGSLFLDEVGDLTLSTQSKLLRATEKGEITPVGSDETLRVDARLISATHRDLGKLVAMGQFRLDFLGRISGVVIRLPGLSEHLEDMSLYVEYFLTLHAEVKGEDPKRLRPGALDVLVKHSWPGNVRELKFVLERAAEKVEGGEISSDDLSESIQMGILAGSQRAEGHGMPAGEAERDLIATALYEAQGIVVHAARKLRMSRRNFYRKMVKYGINPLRA